MTYATISLKIGFRVTPELVIDRGGTLVLILSVKYSHI